MRDRIKRFAKRNIIAGKLVFICYLFYSKLISCICIIMRILPIQNKKIVFCNMKGKRYGDNPMYICEELLKKDNDYKIVWLINKNVNEELPNKVIRKDYNFWNVIYELVTAHAWVDSNMKDLGILKRKKQLYIQTWHGSYGLKKIGKDLENKISPLDTKVYPHNAIMADLMISNSKRTTEIYRRAFWYTGKVLEVGSPRNDIFFKEAHVYNDKVRKYFKLDNQKIVLYAPTYRSNYRTDDFKLDYLRLKQTLENRFGGSWIVLIRLHPNNLLDAKDFIEYTETVINASEYSIMQELLVASDILITDYSSCMFDFATTKKPCFLYATDVARYKEEQDNYFELNELPFPVAENNEQLERLISSFEQMEYEKKLDILFNKVGLNETGRASAKTADYIEEWMENN